MGDSQPSTGKFLLESILERIKRAEDLRFNTDVAPLLGVEKTMIGKWRSRGTVPWDRLIDYAEMRGLSLEWLINGRGPQKLDDLTRIAEPSPRYSGGINYELHNDVAETVHELWSEVGAKVKSDIDQAKVDYLIAYCYNDAVENGGKVDRDRIRAVIKLAM